MLSLRQVDDFAVACPAEDIAKRLHAQIGKALQLPSEDAPPFKCFSLHCAKSYRPFELFTNENYKL